MEADARLREYLGALGAMKNRIKFKIGDDSGKPAEINSEPQVDPDEDDLSLTIRVGGRAVPETLEEEEDRIKK